MSDAPSIEPPCKGQMDPSDNAAAAAITLARTLKVPVSDWRVREHFRVHPSPNSMSAIVEVLPRIGLVARAIRGSWEHLARIPLPLIAHVRRGGEESFVVVQEADGIQVLLADPARGLRRAGREEFQQEASGRFVVCARAADFVPTTPARMRFENALSFVQEQCVGRGSRCAAALLALAVGIGVITAADGGVPAWVRGGMAALTLAGLWISVTLAEAALGGSATAGLLGRLCAQARRFDCSSVLASEHARFLGRVPYAFLGVAFYAALLALGLAGSLAPAVARASWTASLALLGLALPAAAWLTFLQACVIRAWCLGCTIGHGIHAAAFLVALAGACAAGFPAGVMLGTWVALALLAGSAAAAALFFYQARAERAAAAAARTEWFALTRNPEVLRAVLAGVPAAPNLEAANECARGPVDAPAQVALFSAPFCRHCPPAHRALRDLAERSGAARYTCRLVTVDPPPSCPDFLDAARPITPLEMCATLHAVGVASGADAFHAALETVFGRQEEFRRMRPVAVLAALHLDPAGIAAALPAGYERLLVDARIAALHRITHTPTLAVNGRPLPAWASLEQGIEAIRQRA